MTPNHQGAFGHPCYESIKIMDILTCGQNGDLIKDRQHKVCLHNLITNQSGTNINV